MQQSKNLALMFLLGTFLTGGALGFSADRFINREQVCTSKVHSASSGGMRDVLATRLGLNPEQAVAVDSILDDRSRLYKKAFDPVRPQFDSIKQNARQQIRRVLTQDQRARFEQLLDEMNDSTKKEDNEA